MKHFGPILDSLLEINLQQQQRHNDQKMVMSHLQWLYEFGTVSVNLGRATGKTTAIQHRATSKDAVVFRDSNRARDFLAHASFKPHVMTREDCEYPANKWRGFSIDRVWIDDASHIGEEAVRNVYQNASLCSVKQVIMLG